MALHKEASKQIWHSFAGFHGRALALQAWGRARF